MLSFTPLAIAPLVKFIFEMGVQDLNSSYNSAVTLAVSCNRKTDEKLGYDIGGERTTGVGEENTRFGVRVVR